MSTPVKRRRASRPQGAQECQGAAREEPVPLSERLTNGLVKIIALEDIKDIPKEYGNVLIALFFVVRVVPHVLCCCVSLASHGRACYASSSIS